MDGVYNLKVENTTWMANSSTVEPMSLESGIYGFICAGVAVIGYGSNFVPVKKYETGDGMFFQWVLCSAILVVGMVVNLIRQNEEFYALVMVGGVIWATGNICVVPIFKTIGMGLGICIWGTFNMLSGWASGRFGFFGINQQIPRNLPMNYASVCLAVVCVLMYVFIKSEIPVSSQTLASPALNTDDPNYGSTNTEPLIEENSENFHFSKSSKDKASERNRMSTVLKDESFIDKLSPVTKRILGCVLAILSGILYGVSFTPAIYVQDRYAGSSSNALDYVFAHFCGIYITSTFYFTIYGIYMRNRPCIYPEVIIPGIISGIMWAAATTCWFVANKDLSEPVAFPIITTLPGAIASVWGVFYFNEIKGLQNYLLLGFALCMSLGVGLLAGFSR